MVVPFLVGCLADARHLPLGRHQAGDRHLKLPRSAGQPLGVFFGFFGLPIFRHWRTAMSTSTTPMAIFTARAASDGAVLGLGGLLPVMSTVPATTMASDRSHPKMNAAPFRTPPLDASTRMKAVSGIGSSVMTRPISNRSRITSTPCYLSVPTLALMPKPVEPGYGANNGRTARAQVGTQSLLWRNLRTKTTTNKMAMAAKMNPPM